MSDEPEAAWSSGLSRSYSEHAALVLQHYQQHRRRLPGLETATGSAAPTSSLKYTRSGPEFRRATIEPVRSEEEVENGQRTWRISSSASDDEKQQPAHRRRNIIEVGCGDSSALSAEFSELSLTHDQQQSSKCHYGAVLAVQSETTISQNTRTSSVERRCKLFDDDDDDENFALIDLDDEEYNDDDDYREFREQSRQADNECKQMYAINNEVMSTSCTSLNTVTSSRQRLNGTRLNRQISYENWARDKQKELQRRKDEERRAEQKRRELEEREQREREEKERRDYECYLEWLERKKREKQLKRELMDKELDLQRRIQDVEDKAKLAKNICLRQWQRKKEEQKKALEKEEFMKKKKAEEEKQRRLQESLKAYEKWREKSKNTPRPATQGLLPHQKAKPAFTNPTPWQPLVNLDSDESDAENQTVISNTAIKNQRNKRVGTKR